jgi:DNA-binding ferritin-like protein (Dps family)
MTMALKWVENKQRYRRYVARKRQLPPDYRTTVDALQRYSYYFAHGTSEGSLALLEDLIDLFEQSAASGTPVRAVVGEDPVEFADAFIRNYPEGTWIVKERERLTDAVNQATKEKP